MNLRNGFSKCSLRFSLPYLTPWVYALFMKNTAKTVLIVAILAACSAIAFNVRAFLPYPTNYITRLVWLNGWSSRGYYAFNCSGFISNAHGEAFMSEREMFAAKSAKLRIVAEFADRSQIDESKLQAGDVAAFAGPEGLGLHVAAFLKPGVWIDGDTRRGYVATYRLQDKPATDEWFSGKVRIVRWTTPAERRGFTSTATFFDDEQASIGRKS